MQKNKEEILDEAWRITEAINGELHRRYNFKRMLNTVTIPTVAECAPHQSVIRSSKPVNSAKRHRKLAATFPAPRAWAIHRVA